MLCCSYSISHLPELLPQPAAQADVLLAVLPFLDILFPSQNPASLVLLGLYPDSSPSEVTLKCSGLRLGWECLLRLCSGTDVVTH